jgi:hypothetical protein
MGLGTMTHKALEEAIPVAFPGAQVEVRVVVEDFASGSADILLEITNDDRGELVLIEMKTVNGYKFKTRATTFDGPPQGPDQAHKVQGAIYAKALDADRLVVLYLSMENVSPKLANKSVAGEAGRFSAEWHYTRDEFLPLAEAELRRARRIVQFIDEGRLPPRSSPEIPSGARIVDPDGGIWNLMVRDQNAAEGERIARTGSTWICGYCDFRDRCIADGPS